MPGAKHGRDQAKSLMQGIQQLNCVMNCEQKKTKFKKRSVKRKHHVQMRNVLFGLRSTAWLKNKQRNALYNGKVQLVRLTTG